MPRIVLASVDLPEPDSPTSPSVSPSNRLRSTLTSAGTSWPLWWKVFDTCEADRASSPVDRLPPDDCRRLDELPEPVEVVAARPAPPPDVDDRRLDRPAQLGRQRAAVDEHAGRQVRPDLGQVAGDRRERSLRLADAVAWERPQQPERVRVLRALEDGRRVALLDDLAGVHHADPVAQRPDDAEVVGDEQDGGVGLGLERADEVEDARLDGSVEPGRRLVEDEELGVARPARWR